MPISEVVSARESCLGDLSGASSPQARALPSAPSNPRRISSKVSPRRRASSGSREPISAIAFATRQPRQPASLRNRVRHYRNLELTAGRLARLFAEFRFTSAREVLGL